MVITNQTGTTMRLRQLWSDWNPKRLRRLLSLKDGQITANANLAAHYHREMLSLKKNLEQVNQMLDLAHRQVRVLQYELETKEDANNV